MFGFSALHGPHQLAQKSTNTYLPFKEDSVKGFPLTSFCVKSGSAEPICPKADDAIVLSMNSANGPFLADGANVS